MPDRLLRVFLMAFRRKNSARPEPGTARQHSSIWNPRETVFINGTVQSRNMETGKVTNRFTRGQPGVPRVWCVRKGI